MKLLRLPSAGTRRVWLDLRRGPWMRSDPDHASHVPRVAKNQPALQESTGCTRWAGVGRGGGCAQGPCVSTDPCPRCDWARCRRRRKRDPRLRMSLKYEKAARSDVTSLGSPI